VIWSHALERAFRRVCVLLAACLLASCGGEATPYQPPLEGMVAWTDGNPPFELEGGSIEFESGGKTIAQTGLRPDGTFILAEALPAGTYRVRIVPPPADSGLPAVLDPKFTSFDTSGLTYNAADDDAQQASFKITKKRR
jgi:hypothetical protein